MSFSRNNLTSVSIQKYPRPGGGFILFSTFRIFHKNLTISEGEGGGTGVCISLTGTEPITFGQRIYTWLLDEKPIN